MDQSKLDKLLWQADCVKSAADSVRSRCDAAEDPCWAGYEQRGTKEKGGATVPNCVEADSARADATSAQQKEGQRALQQIKELMEMLDEREDRSSRNNGYRQHRTDIQRWVRAVQAAGLTIPAKLQEYRNFWH